MKTLHCVVILIISVLLPTCIFAQTTSTNVKLTLTLIQGKCDTDPSDNEGGIDPRWKIFYNGTQRTVGAVNDVSASPTIWYDLNKTIVSDLNFTLGGNITLGLEGWEEDFCGNANDYNTCTILQDGNSDDDDQHCGATSTVFSNSPLAAMHAGNFTAANAPSSNFLTLDCGPYHVRVLVTFTPVPPSKPGIKLNGTVYNPSPSSPPSCQDGSAITLTTTIAYSFPTDITYTWQYNIGNETYDHYVLNPNYCSGPVCEGGGPINVQARQAVSALAIEPEGPIPACCNEPMYILEDPAPLLWRTISGTTAASTANGDKTFALNSLSGMAELTQNTNVYFRAIASAGTLSSEVSQTSIAFYATPQPPKGILSPIADPSCTNGGSGVVHVTGVTSLFPTYRYLLKMNDVEEAGCDPGTDGSCLDPGDLSGQITDDEDHKFDITGVTPGIHTLFLLNNAGTQGFCPRRIGTVNVPEIPQLIVNQNPVVPTNVTCNGIYNGSITVSISAGNPANILYTLKNNTTGVSVTRTSTTANASVSIPDLNPGDYKLTVDDHCTNPVTRNFIITQPIKVSQKDSEFEFVAATCSNPGNGIAKISVERSAGAFDVSVSNMLVYEIFKDDISFDRVESTNLIYTWNNLPPSTNYKIKVKEKDGADCNGAEKTFSIAAPSTIGMSSSSLLVTPVSCFGGNNGAISVRGTGRTDFIYHITGRNGTTITNTTGDFSALTAGGYKLVINNTVTCYDNYTKTDSIQVSQPQLLVASISKVDISCYGLTDGKINSTVTGGPVGTEYVYVWETYLGGTNPQWVEIANQEDDILLGRGDGKYRLRVKDDNHCDAISNEVTILEPAQLIMSAATVSDIVCLGEKGKIVPTVIGGTTPYTFYYSTNNWTTSTIFTATTLLDANVYQVKVKDKNSCEYIYPDNRVITSPPTAVSFTEQLSDFNGFNISCYGGSNGSAVITAMGGNGGSYSGYTFTVDNRAYQTNPTLENIPAGSHTLHVKDARGCIVSKTLPFTQTSALLAAQVVNKQDLVCFDGATGFIEITGTGGNAPFQYSIDGGTFADAGKFTQLKKGIYNITVKDRNNCTSASPYELISLHPELIIQTSITDVSCFDGKDGAVATTVVGGASPYQYQWNEVSSTSANITALGVGTYTLTVTDQVSCTMKTTATVQQPLQPLKIRLATVPVCYDRPNGSITATVNGGTAPYQYSIDNGVTYQQEIAFSKGAGNYVITSRDSKGCLITSSTTIEVRNTMPEPNFLVASARNALDTLAIIDISVPKPDSIHWTFDPQAIVIKDDPWTPELRFTEPGTYQVKMTGFFAGCDYSVTKKMTLSPYDPSVAEESLPGYKPIESMTVTPNPSNGEFEVNIKLTKKYKLSIVIFDVLGVRHYNKNWTDLEELSEKIVLTDVPAGVYMLRAITESDAKDVRIVINK